MKKIIPIIITLIMIFSTVSCKSSRPSYEILSAFVHAYGADGVIYSSDAAEGEEGYIDEELFDRIYIHSGAHPDDFSIFLSSHTDSRSECGVFVCRDGQMLAEVTDMCEERIRLLDPERGFVSRCNLTVFYSTMSNSDRAHSVWDGIIGR